MLARLFVLPSFTIALLAAPATASPQDECYALHDTHPAASACLTERVKGTEGALKAALEQAKTNAQKMEKITDGSMKAVAPLEASQKAFEAYRKAACDDAIPPMWGGGSGTGDAVAACTITLNRARIEWLQTNYPE
ncbi:MAG: lysozyme inhibitor LprI family protein [Pseudomonadota bacterium]